MAVPLLSMRLEIHCTNHAASVPLLGTDLEVHCRNRAVPVPVPLSGMRLETYFPNRAATAPQTTRLSVRLAGLLLSPSRLADGRGAECLSRDRQSLAKHGHNHGLL